MEQYNSPDEAPWVPITKVTSDDAVKHAQFAVKSHNESKRTNLVFKSVHQGCTRRIGGRKYVWLHINVKNGSSTEMYRADMYGWAEHKVLQNFKPVG